MHTLKNKKLRIKLKEKSESLKYGLRNMLFRDACHM